MAPFFLRGGFWALAFRALGFSAVEFRTLGFWGFSWAQGVARDFRLRCPGLLQALDKPFGIWQILCGDALADMSFKPRTRFHEQIISLDRDPQQNASKTPLKALTA